MQRKLGTIHPVDIGKLDRCYQSALSWGLCEMTKQEHLWTKKGRSTFNSVSYCIFRRHLPSATPPCKNISSFSFYILDNGYA